MRGAFAVYFFETFLYKSVFIFTINKEGLFYFEASKKSMKNICTLSFFLSFLYIKKEDFLGEGWNFVQTKKDKNKKIKNCKFYENDGL